MHELVTDGERGKMFKSEKARENKCGVPEVTGRRKNAEASFELTLSAVGFSLGRSGTRCVLAHGHSRNKFLKPLSGKWAMD